MTVARSELIQVRHFQGQYRFLSNFWPCQIVGPGGNLYPSVEHAYAASKTFQPHEWALVLDTIQPGAVKRLSRGFKLRPDWDIIKLKVMRDLLLQKFANNSQLGNKLRDIDGIIQEGNNWNDKFWGVDLKTGEGENHLGKILMKIRDELRK